MKKSFLILIGIICFIDSAAQNDQPISDSIFTKVELETAFPGGEKAWRIFLMNNLNADIPTNNGAKPKRYTVVIQFVVDTAGNISDIRPLTKHGYGMEEEVMRVIRKGPKWDPAIVNGRKVKAYRKQPVTFQVSRE